MSVSGMGCNYQPIHRFLLWKLGGAIYDTAIADMYNIRAIKADLFVDVGANIGAFSCLAASAHPDAMIYSFEPQAEKVAILRENIRLNNRSNIEIVPYPVTSDGRRVSFDINLENDSSSNMYGAVTPQHRRITLDSVTLAIIPFHSKRSVFIKLDCEGAEGELIPWLVTHRQELSPACEIACDVHPWSPIPFTGLLEMLRAGGFVVTEERQHPGAFFRARSIAR